MQDPKPEMRDGQAAPQQADPRVARFRAVDNRRAERPPSRAVRIFRPLARAWCWITGFKIEGQFPPLKRFVIIAAPHTTNWDFPHALAAGIMYGRPIIWVGKNALFRWPFGGVMRSLGGVSVDRSKANNAVDAIVDMMHGREDAALVITPSGTRSATMNWRTGYYHIALGAGVPIVLAFVDYKRKVIGIFGQIDPTGDYEADFERITALYAGVIDMNSAGRRQV